MHILRAWREALEMEDIMSAFLGPIHHWLYHKIKTQEELVEQFLCYAKEQGATDLRSKVDATYGTLPQESLELVIDEMNIHGWLQDKVSMVEGRLAMVVTSMLQEGKIDMDTIRKIAYDFGKSAALVGDVTPQDAYKQLNDTFVDGMPCDHVNVLISQKENEIIWKRSQCVHESYWNEVSGDVSVYYEIRTEWIKGMFSGTSLTFTELEEDMFSISL